MHRDVDFSTLPLDLGHELIIDNFAGGGGASEALLIALGRDPDVAINHDGPALAMHAANHPTTKHYQEDVYRINTGVVTQDQPIGVGWFSPTCTHFSKAKGDNILDQKIRGLAWVIVKWAALQAPRLLLAENVIEFLTWCPLNAAGKPIKELKGRTFDAFVKTLTTGLAPDHPDMPEIREALGPDFPYEKIERGLGYKMEWKSLKACDYGAGTIRDRLYMIMRRDGLPIVWPAPTHGDPKSDAVKTGKLLPHIMAADSIDFSIPCPSIFDRKKPLVPASLGRVGKGLRKFVLDAEEPYYVNSPHHATETVAAGSLVQYYSGGGQIMPLSGPAPTVVTKDRVGVQCAYLVKHFKGVVGAPLQKPLPTVTTVDHNAVVVANLIGIDNQSSGNSAAWDARKPLTTVTTENRHAVVMTELARSSTEAATLVPRTAVASNIVKMRGTNVGSQITTPLHTVSAGGQHHAEVRTTLTPDIGAAATKRQQIREFLWQYCPGMQGIAEPELVTLKGVLYEIIDIGLRMLTPRELANAQGFRPDYILDPLYRYINKKGKAVVKPLTKSDQVRMIGNSVSPPPAIALLKANTGYEQLMQRAA